MYNKSIANLIPDYILHIAPNKNLFPKHPPTEENYSSSINQRNGRVIYLKNGVYDKFICFSSTNNSKEIISIGETRCKLDTCPWKPRVTINEPLNSEKTSGGSIFNHMITGPSDPARQRCTRPIISVLTVPQSVEGKVSEPLKPASGLNKPTHVGINVNCPGVLFPGPAQVGGLGGENEAVLDGEARGLVWAFSALGRDGNLLQGKWDSGVYFAVLQHCSTVAENEVYGAIDFALTVELSQGVGVEGVLVPFHTAPVEG